jgi:hypothetical protein
MMEVVAWTMHESYRANLDVRRLKAKMVRRLAALEAAP